MRTLRFELSTRTLVLVLAVVGVIWLAARLWPIVILCGASLMLMAALYPVVEWLVRRGVSRILVIVLLALTLLLIVAGVALLIVPVVYDQATEAIARAPEVREDLGSFLEDRGAERLAEGIREFDPTEYIGPILLDTGPQVLGALATAATMLVLTAYLLLDAHRLNAMLFRAAPANWHRHMRVLLPGLRQAVGGYIRGQATMSGIIFTFVVVLFLALGLPSPAAFAVLAAIGDCIPVVGVFFVVVPLALAAGTIEVWKGLVVAGAMVAYTQLENQVLVQVVMGKALDIPPALVLVAVLSGGKLFGVAGALLSLPAAAATKVIVDYLLDLRDGRVPTADELATGTAAVGAAPTPGPSPTA